MPRPRRRKERLRRMAERANAREWRGHGRHLGLPLPADRIAHRSSRVALDGDGDALVIPPPVPDQFPRPEAITCFPRPIAPTEPGRPAGPDHTRRPNRGDPRGGPTWRPDHEPGERGGPRLWAPAEVPRGCSHTHRGARNLKPPRGALAEYDIGIPTPNSGPALERSGTWCPPLLRPWRRRGPRPCGGGALVAGRGGRGCCCFCC